MSRVPFKGQLGGPTNPGTLALGADPRKVAHHLENSRSTWGSEGSSTSPSRLGFSIFVFVFAKFHWFFKCVCFRFGSSFGLGWVLVWAGCWFCVCFGCWFVAFASCYFIIYNWLFAWLLRLFKGSFFQFLSLFCLNLFNNPVHLLADSVFVLPCMLAKGAFWTLSFGSDFINQRLHHQQLLKDPQRPGWRIRSRHCLSQVGRRRPLRAQRSLLGLCLPTRLLQVREGSLSSNWKAFCLQEVWILVFLWFFMYLKASQKKRHLLQGLGSDCRPKVALKKKSLPLVDLFLPLKKALSSWPPSPSSFMSPIRRIWLRKK